MDIFHLILVVWLATTTTMADTRTTTTIGLTTMEVAAETSTTTTMEAAAETTISAPSPPTEAPLPTQAPETNTTTILEVISETIAQPAWQRAPTAVAPETETRAEATTSFRGTRTNTAAPITTTQNLQEARCADAKTTLSDSVCLMVKNQGICKDLHAGKCDHVCFDCPEQQQAGTTTVAATEVGLGITAGNVIPAALVTTTVTGFTTTMNVLPASFVVSMVLQGDFTAVVGANKAGFISECTAALSDDGARDVACTDVKPPYGIVVDLTGSIESVTLAVTEVQSNGLDLPSFPKLDAVPTIPAPATTAAAAAVPSAADCGSFMSDAMFDANTFFTANGEAASCMAVYQEMGSVVFDDGVVGAGNREEFVRKCCEAPEVTPETTTKVEINTHTHATTNTHTHAPSAATIANTIVTISRPTSTIFKANRKLSIHSRSHGWKSPKLKHAKFLIAATVSMHLVSSSA